MLKVSTRKSLLSFLLPEKEEKPKTLPLQELNFLFPLPPCLGVLITKSLHAPKYWSLKVSLKGRTKECCAAGEMGFNHPLLALGYFDIHQLVVPAWGFPHCASGVINLGKVSAVHGCKED